MANEELTKNIAYIVLILVFVAMARLVAKRAGENRQTMLDAAAPKIAGEDTLEGGAKTRANSMNLTMKHSNRWPTYLAKMTTINERTLLLQAAGF